MASHLDDSELAYLSGLKGVDHGEFTQVIVLAASQDCEPAAEKVEAS